MNRTLIWLICFSICLTAAACSSPGDPGVADNPSVIRTDGSLRIAALDYKVGDLTDPAVMAKYARADLLIVQASYMWASSNEGDMALLRAANPDMKVIGYFGSKHMPLSWGDYPRETHAFMYDMYQASLPYWATTTTGDTLMDWPNSVVFDYTNPAARQAMLDVFVHYQETSSNRFDGVFWDYFSNSMWISPQVTGLEGDPDLDNDGIPHWDDPDEIQAFLDGQDAWQADMQAAMGADFIQIPNGVRALQDSVFAAKFDGMFYEIFPNVGFGGGDTFGRALDPTWYNNLFAAHNWPRTTNGGPWLILSHAKTAGSYRTPDGTWETVNPSELLRAVALLTDATSTHYDNSGSHIAGVPDVELDLGAPLAPVEIIGDRYVRHFERGRVELVLGSGQYPVPFSYAIPQNGVVVEQFGEISIAP